MRKCLFSLIFVAGVSSIFPVTSFGKVFSSFPEPLSWGEACTQAMHDEAKGVCEAQGFGYQCSGAPIDPSPLYLDADSPPPGVSNLIKDALSPSNSAEDPLISSSCSCWCEPSGH